MTVIWKLNTALDYSKKVVLLFFFWKIHLMKNSLSASHRLFAVLGIEVLVDEVQTQAVASRGSGAVVEDLESSSLDLAQQSGQFKVGIQLLVQVVGNQKVSELEPIKIMKALQSRNVYA